MVVYQLLFTEKGKVRAMILKFGLASAVLHDTIDFFFIDEFTLYASSPEENKCIQAL